MHVLTAEDLEDVWDDEPTEIYCPACENRGYLNRVGPKILVGNQPRPDNYEDLWECAVCGLNGDISFMPKQETIKNTIETQETPQDDKLKLVSAHKRRVPKRKVNRHIKKNIRQTTDKDILREIQQHGSENVKVIYDSNP
jgi:rubredoxin